MYMCISYDTYVYNVFNDLKGAFYFILKLHIT